MQKEIDFFEEIGNFVFTSKYARYDEKHLRRETWLQAVKRVEKMHLKKYSYLPEKDLQEISWAFDHVREKNIVPSMRSMQFGGRPIEAQNSRMFNCLHKNTKFITSTGVKSFADFSHGDITTVLTNKGNWKRAVVRNYGKDKLYPIKFKRGKWVEETVYATRDHTWILKDGSTTQNIQTGDFIQQPPSLFTKFNYDTAPIDERLYWCYGMVYGDGTITQNQWSLIRLCDKDVYYKYRFEEMGFSTSSPLSIQGDVICYTGKYLKTLPDPRIDEPRLIRAFVRGFLDADGIKNHNGTNTHFNNENTGTNPFTDIHQAETTEQKKGVHNFIRTCFPVAGEYIVSEDSLDGQETNYGVIHNHKKFRIVSDFGSNNQLFKVIDIGNEDNFIYDDVWCLEVEDDHSFVLPNGIVTGNCAVRHIDSIRSFSEIFFLLMCGVGVGFGLSKKYLARLPDLVDASDRTGTVVTYVVEDSIEGWSDAVEALLSCYLKNNAYTGRKIVFDFSRIRKKGAPIKTGGGKAPGHEGLKQSLRKIKDLLDHSIEVKGQKRLTSVNAYDIVMHMADAVLSGGVRRSATIALFGPDDDLMINAKTNFKVTKSFMFEKSTNKKGETIWEGRVIVSPEYGGKVGHKYDVVLTDYEYTEMLHKDGVINWRHIEPQRARSNNSVMLMRNKVTPEFFDEIVHKIQQYGEPGFVFTDHEDFLVNPCAEVGFIPVTRDGVCGVQFCNLVSMNGKHIDSREKFMEYAKAATIIGTLQAGYTDFKYLGKASKHLTDEEALLGVSITGFMDNPNTLLDPKNQADVAQYTKKINKDWAQKIGVNQAARITLVKPEGTTSLMLGTASGIHPHHSRRYFRRIQCNRTDNVYKHFKSYNEHATEESIWSATMSDDIAIFPLTVSEKAMIKTDLSAIEHLNYILSTQKNWVLNGETESNIKGIHHNVSCTVIVDDTEWKDVVSFIYENREFFTAVSFLPKMGDKIYKQAPNEAISTPEDEVEFNRLINNWKRVEYTKMSEEEDATELQKEVACAGGACELTHI
jgi:ribonucleoside-diphosphate reductase alpha chain